MTPDTGSGGATTRTPSTRKALAQVRLSQAARAARVRRLEGLHSNVSNPHSATAAIATSRHKARGCRRHGTGGDGGLAGTDMGRTSEDQERYLRKTRAGNASRSNQVKNTMVPNSRSSAGSPQIFAPSAR